MRKIFLILNAAGLMWLLGTLEIYGHAIDVAEAHARPPCDAYFQEATKGGGA